MDFIRRRKQSDLPDVCKNTLVHLTMNTHPAMGALSVFELSLYSTGNGTEHPLQRGCFRFYSRQSNASSFGIEALRGTLNGARTAVITEESVLC